MKKKLLLWLILVPLGLVVALLYGCQPSQSEMNLALTQTQSSRGDQTLYDPSCPAPCWHGLLPGTSTAKDVEHVLDNLVLTEWPGYLTDSYKETGCTWIARYTTDREKSVDLYLKEGILTFIQLVDGRPTMKQIVETLSSPEYYRAILSEGPDGPPVYAVEVYYPSKGIAFDLGLIDNQDYYGMILPEMRAKVIHYFSPGELSSYLTNKYSCHFELQVAAGIIEREIERNIQPWSGFGEVEVITEQ